MGGCSSDMPSFDSSSACDMSSTDSRLSRLGDPETVTRLSKLRKATGGLFGGDCKPVACTAGRVGDACDGENDDATCDSSPGKGDGECDACPITGGESTENEMFNLFGLYYVDPAGAAGG